jgi:hypothetical protein
VTHDVSLKTIDKGKGRCLAAGGGVWRRRPPGPPTEDGIWQAAPEPCPCFGSHADRFIVTRNKFLGTGEPGYHPLRKIKVTKDISAAAVGIGIVLWGTISVVEIVRLWRLFRQI